MGSCNPCDGRKKYRVGLLSPHLSHRSPPLFPLVLCDNNCFYSCHDNVEHTTLVLAGSVLSCSTEALRKHTRRRAGRRGAGLVPAEEGRSTGRRPQQQPHLLPIGFLPDPCALQSTHQVNLPPFPPCSCWKMEYLPGRDT